MTVLELDTLELEDLLTFEAFEAMLPMLDPKRRYELQNGVLIEVGGSSRNHTVIGALIIRLIGNYVEEQGLGGDVSSADGTFRLTPHDTSIPDVAYVRPDKVALLVEDTVFYPFAPDLAVEIRSPSQSKREMNALAVMYLNAGTQLVWIVDPNLQMVTVYNADNSRVVLTGEAELDGGAVLRGFKLPLKRIFAQIKLKGANNG